jgi:hypothetical protein
MLADGGNLNSDLLDYSSVVDRTDRMKRRWLRVIDNKEKMIAFINSTTNEHKVFKKPIRFDMRHRTFVALKPQDLIKG